MANLENRSIIQNTLDFFNEGRTRDPREISRNLDKVGQAIKAFIDLTPELADAFIKDKSGQYEVISWIDVADRFRRTVITHAGATIEIGNSLGKDPLESDVYCMVNPQSENWQFGISVSKTGTKHRIKVTPAGGEETIIRDYTKDFGQPLVDLTFKSILGFYISNLPKESGCKLLPLLGNFFPGELVSPKVAVGGGRQIDRPL